MAARPESEGWFEGDSEPRGRVLGSFPTVASIGVWGSPPSCGLGQQRTGGKWYSGEAQVWCPGGGGKGGIHCALKRVCCHLSHHFFCPPPSSSPLSSSLFSSNLLTSLPLSSHPTLLLLASPLPQFSLPL